MFKNSITLLRYDTTSDFFYDHDGVLNDPVYIALADRYKSENKLISETINNTDELTFVRETTWDSEISFDEFLSEWYQYRPEYLSDIQFYCIDHNHVFHPERINL
jgi:hypothetical protein